MQKYTHIIWDWNGTLLDDVAWCMTSINVMLKKRGLPVLDSVDAYHRVFGFPVIDYYRRVGFDFEKEPFEKLAAEYIDLYHDNKSDASLFPEAKGTLADFQNKGIHQIILSASEMKNLLSQIKPFGIDSFFDEVLGIPDIFATSKIDLGKAYVKRTQPESAVLIGDTIHDKEVADVLGVDCILVANGHQSKKALLSVNAVVVDSLADVKNYIGLRKEGCCMDVKMIVTDLDRTLLWSDKSISEYTARVLSACQQRGIFVVFATARSENSCKRFTDMIKPDAIVSNGGALVRIGEKTIYRSAMSMETVSALLLSCLEQPNVGYITVDTDKGYFVNKPVDTNDPGWIENLPAFHVDFSKGLDCDAYKITVEIEDETTANRIASDFPTVDVIPFSGEGWYRFADKNADKWHGVKALAVNLGVKFADITAFGDDHNDVEMLRECGIGIAVANAIDEVRAIANHICGTNDDDGVAKWLEENLL